MREFFRKFATTIALWTGSASAFLLAASTVIAWAVSKPLYKDTNTWLLWINSITTIVTYLMVFLIQYSSNRDIKALNIKISELVIAKKSVDNSFATVEDLSDDDLTELEKRVKEEAKNRTNRI